MLKIGAGPGGVRLLITLEQVLLLGRLSGRLFMRTVTRQQKQIMLVFFYNVFLPYMSVLYQFQLLLAQHRRCSVLLNPSGHVQC